MDEHNQIDLCDELYDEYFLSENYNEDIAEKICGRQQLDANPLEEFKRSVEEIKRQHFQKREEAKSELVNGNEDDVAEKVYVLEKSIIRARQDKKFLRRVDEEEKER